MEHDFHLSESLKDLKTLRSQLYSAAEYFELSYINDDYKQMVANTLKNYAVQAIVNTVDHLGSASDIVNGLLDENVDEVTENEIRVSCVEQRIKTCRGKSDIEGLSEQSLAVFTPRYHKRYSLSVDDSMGGSAQSLTKQQNFRINDVQKTTGDTSPLVRKMCAPSPSKKPATGTAADKRSVSPLPSPRLFRSRSTSCRITPPSSCNTSRCTSPTSSKMHRAATFNCSNEQEQHLSEPRRSASMRMPSEWEVQRETEKHRSRSRRLFQALLGRHKQKSDPMIYSYIDEY